MKSWIERILADGSETKCVFKFIKLASLGSSKSSVKILDVGCGYGRNLSLLQQQGYDALGVETNSAIVKVNREKGLKCISVGEFKESQEKFDVIIMSHIIEHFAPRDLLPFMDDYLDHLKAGGHLIVCTPLLTKNFFDDFDHVKPYQPVGIQMVFGKTQAQVQYYSKNKLQLKDIWFRRSFCRIHFHRSQYIKSLFSRVLLLADICLSVVFKVSFGLLGRKTGWVGLYEKIL